MARHVHRKFIRVCYTFQFYAYNYGGCTHIKNRTHTHMKERKLKMEIKHFAHCTQTNSEAHAHTPPKQQTTNFENNENF